MSMQNNTTTPPILGDDRLSWPDCAYCDQPMRLRSISYTAQRQMVTFECTACSRQAAGCVAGS